MMTVDTVTIRNTRKETDGLGELNVPAHVLWSAQTQRPREHLRIGQFGERSSRKEHSV